MLTVGFGHGDWTSLSIYALLLKLQSVSGRFSIGGSIDNQRIYHAHIHTCLSIIQKYSKILNIEAYFDIYWLYKLNIWFRIWTLSNTMVKLKTIDINVITTCYYNHSAALPQCQLPMIQSIYDSPGATSYTRKSSMALAQPYALQDFVAFVATHGWLG